MKIDRWIFYRFLLNFSKRLLHLGPRGDKWGFVVWSGQEAHFCGKSPGCGLPSEVQTNSRIQ